MTTLFVSLISFDGHVHVLGSSTNRVESLRNLGTMHPDWKAVRAAVCDLDNAVVSATSKGTFDAACAQKAMIAGEFLFEELLPTQVKQWLRKETGELILNLSEDLDFVPWELLHTGRDFICARWSMGRTIAGIDPVPPDEEERNSLRALIIADPEGSLNSAYDEGWAIHTAAQAHPLVTPTFRACDVESWEIRQSVRSFDLVHFAGHVDHEGWRVTGGHFDFVDVEKLTGGSGVPQLVITMGCAAASSPMKNAWLRAGVRHFVGPVFAIPDRLASRFSVRFHSHLFEGDPIGEAARKARADVSDEFGLGAVPWGVVALYGKPSTRYLLSEMAELEQSSARDGSASKRKPPGTARIDRPLPLLTRSTIRPVPSDPARDPLTLDMFFAAVLVITIVVGVLFIQIAARS